MKRLLMLSCSVLALTGAAHAADIALMPHVPDNATLSATKSTAYNYLIRDDFSVGLGAPSLTYKASALACPLNAGAGDGGSQVPSADGKCWLAVFENQTADARQFGVIGYASQAAATAGTDATTALTACMAAARCILPAGAGVSLYYRIASLLNVAEGRTLEGSMFAPGGPPIGAWLVCDLAVTPCVVKGQTSAPAANTPRGSGRVGKLIISRAAGAIPASSIGLQVAYEQEERTSDVFVERSDSCIDYKANISVGSGTEAHDDHIYTASCPTSHVVVDGWAVVEIHDLRMGVEGYDSTASSTNAILITGGRANDVNSGPNTVVVDGFTVVAPNVTNFVSFANCNICQGGTNSPVIYKFVNGHAESITHAIASDASASLIADLDFANTTFFNSGDFFALNAATQIQGWHIGGFVSGNGTLSPTPVINGLKLDAFLQGSWLITGASGSEVDACGATLDTSLGSLLLRGGPFVNPKPCNPMQVNNLANGGQAHLTDSGYGGLISIRASGATNDGALFFAQEGVVASPVTQIGTTFVAGCSPAAGKIGVGYNCDGSSNNYDVVNNQGNTLTFNWSVAGVTNSTVR